MPVHRAKRADVDRVVAAFEAAGEAIVFGAVEGSTYVLFTSKRGLTIEDEVTGVVRFVKVGDGARSAPEDVSPREG